MFAFGLVEAEAAAAAAATAAAAAAVANSASSFCVLSSLATLAFCFLDMRPNLTASLDMPSERHFCKRQY